MLIFKVYAGNEDVFLYRKITLTIVFLFIQVFACISSYNKNNPFLFEDITIFIESFWRVISIVENGTGDPS